MALQCLSILGSKNEPLYSCSPPKIRLAEASEPEGDLDGFGFLESMEGNDKAIHHEFMIHAALDRLDEVLGSPKNYQIPKHLRSSHWMGSLCVMEDCEIFGYVTPSNIKILALVKRDDIMPLQKRNDSDVRMLFKVVHDCYVRYTLNPFTTIRSKIEKPCQNFEKGINMAIKKYNDTVDILDDPTVKKFQKKSTSGGSGGGGFFSLTSSSPGLVMK
ncbi:unnamed protein product [Cylindrotheca closterium]|uniref:Trafficking protein particle complex subunit n=1 Tax=Cylindrotheca closterium TaxID=2856 RepID=A0AAD2FJ58_9STRA|nr:unnamed protein product [Cylindrotheca closterium]